MNMAIKVGGKAPFIHNNFDSTRPLLYLNEDESFVYLYMFCPNVTQGSGYKKWSLINIWNKVNLTFAINITTQMESFGDHCPHSVFNQTLIVANWYELG